MLFLFKKSLLQLSQNDFDIDKVYYLWYILFVGEFMYKNNKEIKKIKIKKGLLKSTSIFSMLATFALAGLMFVGVYKSVNLEKEFETLTYDRENLMENYILEEVSKPEMLDKLEAIDNRLEVVTNEKKSSENEALLGASGAAVCFFGSLAASDGYEKCKKREYDLDL